jgi:hypothetical protein
MRTLLDIGYLLCMGSLLVMAILGITLIALELPMWICLLMILPVIYGWYLMYKYK